MSHIFYLGFTIALLGLDRLSKWWVFTRMDIGRPQPLIGNTIRLVRVHNDGGAFGILRGNSTLFLVVSSLVSVGILVMLFSRKVESAWARFGLSVILAGAIGNLIDRAMWGYVLDFFEFRGFPVFNLADACITVGAGIVIIAMLFGGERHRPSGEADRV